MTYVLAWLIAVWDLLAESALYVLFGLLIGGLLKVFLSPGFVARHLGTGRYLSVLKSALLGIPMPLCSCGVLPAAASLKRQGANNGATTAFLVSTPETGVDSMAITYALLGPIMTIARPLAAFAAAAVAGLSENLFGDPSDREITPDLSCPVDGCCDGVDCPAREHAHHHSLIEKLRAGVRFAYGQVWADLVGWFFVGMALAGVIAVVIPDDVMSTYLGGGIGSMLLMLAVGIPIYICATASTPIAATLILKGVSPGTALVFLLAGPATNVTSISVLIGLLGRRAAGIYLASIAVVAVAAGLALDGVLVAFGLSVTATMGAAEEIFPAWLQAVGAVILISLSIRPLWRILRARFSGDRDHHHDHSHDDGHQSQDEPCCDHST